MMLAIDNISKSFGGVVALSDVSLSFKAGNAYGLIGPNGCGKTALLNVLAGFYRPTEGMLRFQLPGRADEVVLNRLSTERRAALGISLAFQEPRSFASLTVEENLALGMIDRKSENLSRVGWWGLPLQKLHERTTELLELGTLEAFREAKAGDLSYGQRKILDVLRLMGRGCRMMLLDEPFAGVDPRHLEVMIRLLQRAVTPSSSVVIVSHEIRFVGDILDEVMLMNEGRIIMCGAPKEVIHSSTFRSVYMGGPDAESA